MNCDSNIVMTPNRTLCFTGHRTLPKCDEEKIISELDKLIEKAVNDGYDCFISGGAVGFDTLAAFRVLKAQKTYPEIKLILALPCRNQTAKWKNIENLKDYQYLKDAASLIVYTQTFYDEGCMMKRNKFMVDHSSFCIGYVNRKIGGSAATLRYAKKKNIRCTNIATDT